MDEHYFLLEGDARACFDKWRAENSGTRAAHRAWVERTLGPQANGAPYGLVYGLWTGLHGVILSEPRDGWARKGQRREGKTTYAPRVGTALHREFMRLPEEVGQYELLQRFHIPAVVSPGIFENIHVNAVVFVLPVGMGWPTGAPEGARQLSNSEYLLLREVGSAATALENNLLLAVQAAQRLARTKPDEVSKLVATLTTALASLEGEL